jgi:hypothetical protein
VMPAITSVRMLGLAVSVVLIFATGF